MMKSSRLEKDKKIEYNMIKDVRNLQGLQEEIDDTRIKDIRNLFRLRKEKEVIKDRVIRDIRNPFKHEEGVCYKPVRVGNLWSNNYIEYESNGDRNKTLSTEEYLNKIRPYFKDIIIDLKTFDTWKIQ